MKKSIFFFCFLYAIATFSQKEANVWYFGVGGGIDFNSGTAVSIDGKPEYTTYYGCATMCSSTGEFLMFSNGGFVYNKNGEEMPNGGALKGSVGSTQATIIVPKPGDTNIYYVFTTDDLGRVEGLRYSEVDLRLDGGLGDVTANKAILLETPVAEKLTAVKSTSFNGYWVLAHRWNSDQFISYKVTTSGVDTTPVVSTIGSFIGGDSRNARGQLKLSPNGKRLVIVSEGTMNELQLFDFNASTGVISNPTTIIESTTDRALYGVEFSPNGKLLYVADKGNDVLQYNLEAGSTQDIKNSVTRIGARLRDDYGSMQLAPDGKLYVAKGGYDYLDYIDKPNEIGFACEYKSRENGLYLNGNVTGNGLPQFVQSFFYVGFSTEKLCEGDATKFIANTSESFDSITWDFGDGTTSSEENPTHLYGSSGTYSVTLTVIANGGADVSVETKEVTIYKSPIANQPNDIRKCDDNNDGFQTFDLSSQTSAILGSQNANMFKVDYYASLLDYQTNNPITSITNYQNTNSFQEQTIIAKVSNKENTDCIALTNFKINVFELPTQNQNISDLAFCDNTSVGNDSDGKIIFNLVDKETEILNGQFSSDFLVSYFIDASFTQEITNTTTYENITSPQIIYVKVANRLNTDCTSTTSFRLNVFSLPNISNEVTLKQCDDDVDGYSRFNLSEANSKIITNPENFTISYFESQLDAENNQAAIVNITDYQNATVSSDTVWVRVESSNNCFRVGKVNLLVSTTQIPQTYTKSFYKCDDGANTSDGIATFDFSIVTNEIRAIFPSNQQLIIKYYENETDALAEINAIPTAEISNYQNTANPYQQNIFIRVDSAIDNDCLGLGHHITLNVDKVPVANPITINPQCDNDNDNDGKFAFDTTNIQNTIVGNQTDISVQYFDENNMQLPSPLPNPFLSSSQTIKVVVTNDLAQDTNGKCRSETFLDFVVNSVPEIFPIPIQETCDDDFDGIASFDTSNIKSSIIGSQTGLIIKYYDEEGNLLPTPLPNPFVSSTQTIKVRVENPNYTICYKESEISFIVREKPNFDLTEEVVICIDSSPSLLIETQNPQGNYTYLWQDELGNTIGANSNLEVSSGGVFFVTAISEFGCESNRKTINVKESSVAKLTYEDVEVIDNSLNNSIKLTRANIGLGDYEYSLLSRDGVTVVDYQDEAVFSDIESGVYLFVVRDKHGCGETSLEISVISYPSFFTPNNDGRNDTWNITGVGDGFYKSGEVQVFNRYGKMVASFDVKSDGWDGLYNGEKLPSNDYWFSAKLIDLNDNITLKKGNLSLLRK